MIRAHVCPSSARQDGIKAGLLGGLRRRRLEGEVKIKQPTFCSHPCVFEFGKVGFCHIWRIWMRLAEVSQHGTHSRYITPFFYVMTAAALRLNLPHTLTVLPGFKKKKKAIAHPKSLNPGE